MNWGEWFFLACLWFCSLKWAYNFGQKQSILLAAQLLDNSRFSVGPALAKRIRQEYDKRLRGKYWSILRNRWPTE